MKAPRLLALALLVLLGCHDNDDEDAAIAAAAATVFLPAAESEPNNDVPTADPMSASGSGSGQITAADVDVWSFGATAGSVIQIEIHALRRDHAAWIAAGSIPEMRLIAPDGTTELLRTQENEFFWGNHDMDLFAHVVATSGTHYLRVSANTGGAGAKYVVTVRVLSYPAFQSETEANDTSGTANPIIPGAVFAHHVDDESDFFSFAITEPTIVYFELQSYRSALWNADDDYYDTELELIDTDGTTVLLNNDDTFFYDSTIHFMLFTSGTYFLRVTECCDAGDADYILLFTTTPVGNTTEVEPNDAIGQATPAGYGTIITANHGVDDDLFSFAGAAGDMVQIYVWDLNNIQGASADLTYTLLEPDGITTVASEYSSGDTQILRAILTQTGTHFVRVTGPTATTYALRFVLFARAGFETEANNSQFTAGSFTPSGFGAGIIATDADVDYWRITAQAGELVTVLAYADQPAGVGNESNGWFNHSGWGSTLQPRARIFDGANTAIADSRTPTAGQPTAESVVNGLATMSVSFVAPTAGTYYVVISAENLPASATHTYGLQKK